MWRQPHHLPLKNSANKNILGKTHAKLQQNCDMAACLSMSVWESRILNCQRPGRPRGEAAGQQKSICSMGISCRTSLEVKKSILPYENRWPYCVYITLLTHSGSAFLWMWDSWRIWMRSTWKFRRLQAYAASIKTIYSQVWVLHWFPGGPNWNMESDTMENTVQRYKTKRNRNWLEMTWIHIKISNRNTQPIFKNQQEQQSYSLPNPSIHPTQSTQMKCGMAWDSTIFTEAFSLRMDIC